MALGGLMQGLLAAQQINSSQQDAQMRQALLALNQRNQQLRAQQQLQALAQHQQKQQAMALLGQGMTGMFGQGAPSPMTSAQPPGPMMPAAAPSGGPPMGGGAMPNIAGGADFKDESPELRSRVGTMTEAMPPDVRQASSIISGFRTPQQQAEIYDRSGQGSQFMAAPPGHSEHEKGMAADWKFDTPQANEWAHQNASKFGLSFPLGPRDPNHMQLAAGVATTAAGALPPQMAGKAGPDMFARLVERIAGSDAPDEVKGEALVHLMPLMSQEGQRQFQQAFEMYKLGVGERDKAEARSDRREDVQDRRQDRAATREQTRELAEERMGQQRQIAEQGKGADWQILQTPDGKAVRVNRKTGETSPVDLPAGTAKLGSQAAGQPAGEAEVKYWSQVLAKGGSLPPGLTRGAAGAKFVRDLMTAIPKESGADPGDFIARHSQVKANTTSLTNMTRMADAATAFEKTASLNFDKALELAPEAIPSDLGPFFNRFVEEGETMMGDPNVPPYVAAILTGANEYAKIMSGATGSVGSTVDSRKEARELFSPYLSLPQLKNVIAVAKNDMGNRMKSNFAQIDDIQKRLGATGTTDTGKPTGGAAKYSVGQVIEHGGKKYRVTGGDLNGDPDVEPAQ